MRAYYNELYVDPFQYIPLTFHIKTGLEDPEFNKFKNYFDKNTKKNIWIVKPGEETNRGYGITVCETMKEIEEIITKK